MSISFPKTEEATIQFWKAIDAFQTQLRLTQNGPRFTFYDGPPFGLPHYGHLLTSTIKDIIPRYWSMKGYHVVRRFGWDTHGLPVEHEVDKKLHVSGREAVLKMGIEQYNAECRAIVMTYAEEWQQVIERLGRWIDFEDDYKSMDVTFMESCWWVFQQLHAKGDVYRAYQIMPFSTALGTPLSHMEERQNEKTTVDPAIVVSFPLLEGHGHENTSLLVYTTTPWTLPSNLLIAVKPTFEYIKILDEKSGRFYMLLEGCLSTLYKDPKKAKYKVVHKIMGSDMVGWRYKPLFEYFTSTFADCFQVIGAEFVEAGEGVGLVHMAPAFGQEDYDAAIAAGFISNDRLPPCPVDDEGRFTHEVADYEGQRVKAADKAIIKDLRPTGRLVVETQVTHVDKFCPRSQTQLIRKAVSAWFIKVTNSTPTMLGNLEGTTWVPEAVKDKRFVNWVTNAHDWNVSRNRYWGTPIPLWVSDDYEEVVFESGSMPYASNHYPFENKDRFQGDLFPADFIAEGLDQTRGWFYTLTVLGNKLFGVSPFRNCIVNGLVLAEDGKKMSKSLKNFPDPSHILDNYGSDALRLYLINSPVVRGEPLRFNEAGVREVISRVLLPLWNSYRFFSEQAILFQNTTGTAFISTSSANDKILNITDRWILADCQSLLRFMDQEMEVVPRLLQVIDNLTNWYIRFNRKRLKGAAGLGVGDTTAALNTLFQVLFTVVRSMAPFTPFITEHIYGLLKPYISDFDEGRENTASVHFLPFPAVQEALLDTVVERQMSAMQRVIRLARTARERLGISLKSPLRSLVVIGDAQFLADVDRLRSYVAEELNVRDIVLTDDEEEYGIHLKAKVDWPTLGKRLKKDVQVVRKALPGLTQEALRTYQREKHIVVQGIHLAENDLSIVWEMPVEKQNVSSPTDGPTWEPSFDEDVVVLLDGTSYPDLLEDGLARDILTRFQKLRKKAGLVPLDDVRMQYSVLANPEGVDVTTLISSRQSMFTSSLRGKLEERSGESGSDESLIEEDQALGNLVLRLRLAQVHTELN
ncbi:hypothetical protein HMPREF1624_02130 [Sporothrix schenckii ATCC 58251]|uniref:isoleucine--tRNA ligase n=1 Tax=Sporothrix schenckii (strain ATCC 58251 / de Perez 2211183) TaxID=1391915 RepID=U7Q2H8_SPOS1|nr:hypothetical protein HMPREF1624_02130 [Sporothrix schenckii ATCC 58251]